MRHSKSVAIGFVILLLGLTLLSGCVSKSEYETLQANYEELQADYAYLQNAYNATKSYPELYDELEADYNKLKADYNKLKVEYEDVKQELAKIKAEQSKPAYTTGTIILGGDYWWYCVAGGDGNAIILVDYRSATNPTYSQLINFLRGDRTNFQPYTDTYICTDFAEDLHNNAEKAGIKASFVCVYFEGDDVGHAVNAFMTVDKKLVYVDNTISDSVVHLEIGKPYADMGIIEDIIIIWRGT